jgi:phosphatidylinositol-3-phosphatase
MIANTVPGRFHFVAIYIAMAAAPMAVTNASVHAQVQENADILPENSTSKHNIQTVFVIPMENRNWSDIKGSSEAPYINKTLLPMAAYANNFLNPLHPSLPNYITFEAGSDLGVTVDGLPSQFAQATHEHLSEQLHNAGISWRAYVESITGKDCPLTPEGPKDINGSQEYVPRHFPQIYFTDMTNDNDEQSSYCIQHAELFSRLAGDLKNNAIGSYNFVVANLCDIGHDPCGGNEVSHFDTWLKENLPAILNSSQYKAGHVLVIILADEARTGDGPTPLILLGAGVKKDYSNDINYSQGSVLRTLQEIFGVSPFLGSAAKANDFSAMFTTFP